MSDYIACGAGLGELETIATALVRTGGITKHDRIRERELFRFYRPKGVKIDSSANTPLSGAPISDLDDAPPISDKDVTLGALAQLVAYRLGVHRSMINVIGRETQYTLVESTRTLDLNNQTTADVQGDESWVGSGGSMHKQQSICEAVVNLPTDGTKESFLIVPDLKEDPRFNTRTYVTGPPHYRFYAGTPLKTAQGVVIGALCAFAHAPRAGLTPTEKAFLVTIADTVMQHLEMKRAAAEKDRVTTMSRALNAFVEGSTTQFAAKLEGKTFRDSFGSPLSDEGRTQDDPDGKIAKLNLDDQVEAKYTAESSAMTITGIPGGFDDEPRSSKDDKVRDLETQQEHETVSVPEQKKNEPLPKDKETETGPGSGTSPPSSKESTPYAALEQQIQSTLTRAAGLLVEALALKDGSGVVFYDTVARIDTPSEGGSNAASPTDYLDDWSNFSDGPITPGVFDGVVDSEDARAPVMGEMVTTSLDEQLRDQSYRDLTSRKLAKLIKRYPSGQIWEFDEHGVIPLADVPGRPALTAEKEARQRVEGLSLSRCFPRVRSLIFVPLWDANLGRHYSGCFVWTTDAMGRFSSEGDFSFVTAFGNSISAEISRLVTIDADQRKSDFIGSISHELRSPLHAILVAADLLCETLLDSEQLAIIYTIDASGRTLLDTINHVLDFSKINSLRRDWRPTSNKLEVPLTGKMPKQLTLNGVMSIMGSTDLAAICEEVINAVYTGKMYTDSSAQSDITSMAAAAAVGQDSEHQLKVLAIQVKPKVQVLLDISPGDYHFVTQPGAVRRIVMNIFGNALKYTDKGSVIVRLFQQGHEGCDEGEHRHKVILVVKDTGRGISSGYMRSRLYTPFAQEDDMTPGTGLGLSIVRTLVTLLRGDISIGSQKDLGTEVRVVFQHMQRPQDGLKPGEHEPERRTLRDFEYLEALPKKMRVGLYRFDPKEELMKETENILRQGLQEFCHSICVTDWRNGPQPDAIIVHEHHLRDLELDASVHKTTNILVLRNTPAPIRQKLPKTRTDRYQFLFEPFGAPYQLARALRRCTDKTHLPLSDLDTIATYPDPSADSGVSPSNQSKSDSLSAPNTQLADQPELEGPARLGKPRLQISTEPQVPTLATFTGASEGLNSEREWGSDRGQQLVSQNKKKTARVSAKSEKPAATLLGTSRLPKVLVVDDSSINVLLLRAFWRKRGVVTDEAVNGAIALRMAKAKSYDMIFMDVSMPVMNGFEATSEIRKHEDTIRRKHARAGSFDVAAESQSLDSSRQQSINVPKAPGQITLPPVSGLFQDASATSGMNLEIGPKTLATPPVSPDEHHDRALTDDNQAPATAQPVQRAIIVACTALGSEQAQIRAFNSGFDMFLMKPLDMNGENGVRGVAEAWENKQGRIGAPVQT